MADIKSMKCNDLFTYLTYF